MALTGESEGGAFAPAPGASDLQHLLARAAERLASRVDARRVLIWETGDRATRDAGALDGSQAAPCVRAACVEGGVLCAPTAGEFAALAALPAASDLGGEHADLAARHEVAAAAPVVHGAEVRWVVLVGGGALAPGAVRPRALAELSALCERLARPAASAGALARLTRLDAEVQRLDRLAVLGALVAEIAHEIRNPLVSVKTFLQLLPEQGADAEFRESFGGLAAEELRRVERLLEGVLQQARPAADGPATAELGASLAAVTRLVDHRAAGRGVALELTPTVAPGDAERAVALSPDALRQALLNLVLNAIDASPPSTRVTIAAEPGARGVAVVIEDEGPGIAPEQRERVFEPFYSTKPERAGGLGLAISRRIAREAGGELEVETAPGGGARFRLRLPWAP